MLCIKTYAVHWCRDDKDKSWKRNIVLSFGYRVVIIGVIQTWLIVELNVIIFTQKHVIKCLRFWARHGSLILYKSHLKIANVAITYLEFLPWLIFVALIVNIFKYPPVPCQFLFDRTQNDKNLFFFLFYGLIMEASASKGIARISFFRPARGGGRAQERNRGAEESKDATNRKIR